MALDNFKDVQAFITGVMEENKTEGAPPPKSPHKAFWLSMSYEEFTTGNVPGVKDPGTGNPLRILTIGDSASSNLILALRGEGSLFNPNTGTFGRMPANNQIPFSDDQIIELANWIDKGCPEFS
jgi:hypothetical protein